MSARAPIALTRPGLNHRAVDISVVIATQRRPEPLARAVASVLAQTGIDAGRVELVVVDNDERVSALAELREAARCAPFAVRYVHEPEPGVANARNAGVEAAAGAWIAFVDDDEEASPGWLAALIETQQRFGADVVFGPVRARLPRGELPHRRYLDWFFSRRGPGEPALIDEYHGCGNSLIRRAALPDPRRPFSPRTNLTGGEDDMLFRTMQLAGATLAWAPDAWVWEDPPPDRVTLAYCLRRAFTYGQGVTYYCATGEPPDPVGAAGWMARGAVQVGVFALISGFKWLTRASDLAFALDYLAKGLGKVFWGGPFAIQFYGHRAARPAPGSEALAHAES